MTASCHPADGHRCRCGLGCGAETLPRVFAAELAGTALLVLLTCLPQSCDTDKDGEASPVRRALTAGLVVAALVQCLDHVSGAQFNPTVTLASAIWGRFSWARAAAMVAAQAAGAALGGGLLYAATPAPRPPALCVTAPAAGVGWALALAVEAALGGVLALANCASWDPRVAHLKDSWPLRVGLTVGGLSLAAGHLTGASINPVRSLAPALWANHWQHHWVYWAGPLSGSALATTAYCALWRPRRPRPRPTLPPHSPHSPHSPSAPPPQFERPYADAKPPRAV